MNSDAKQRRRYIFEQKLLPGMLFSEDRLKCLIVIKQRKGGFFADFLNMMAEHDGDEDGYTQADFTVESVPHFDGNENLLFAVTVVNMPEPEDITQCSRIFICHDGEFENIKYFMAEKSFFGFALCGRDSKGNHLNYGPVSGELKEQAEKVLQYCTEA